MKNKLIVFGVTFLLIFVFLSGCNENNNNNSNNNNNKAELESKFVGTWMWTNYSQLIFHANKTGTYSEFLMTWDIEGNVLTLEFYGNLHGNLSSEFFFADNWNTLTLYDGDGEAVKYKRQ
jgi:hypothetical protein